MGIIDRLSTLIRSNINDLISRAENPQKVLEQLIVDMRNQLAKAKQQVAAAIADEKRLSAQAEQEKKLSEDWEKRAVLAVQEGRDDLAEQIEHEERKLIAAAEVNEDLSGDSLIKQFQGIEVKATADEQLLALKRKMGLLPGGTQEQAKALGKGAKEAELLEDDDAEQKS